MSIGEGSTVDVSVVNSNLTDVKATVRTLREYESIVLYNCRPRSTFMILAARRSRRSAMHTRFSTIAQLQLRCAHGTARHRFWG